MEAEKRTAYRSPGRENTEYDKVVWEIVLERNDRKMGCRLIPILNSNDTRMRQFAEFQAFSRPRISPELSHPLSILNFGHKALSCVRGSCPILRK